RIDHGREHAHVIGGDAVHIAGLLGYSPKEIPASHHQSDLHPQPMNLADLAGDGVDSMGLHSKAFVAGQGLAGKFEADAVEGKHGWSQYSSHSKIGSSGDRLIG